MPLNNLENVTKLLLPSLVEMGSQDSHKVIKFFEHFAQVMQYDIFCFLHGEEAEEWKRFSNMNSNLSNLENGDIIIEPEVILEENTAIVIDSVNDIDLPLKKLGLKEPRYEQCGVMLYLVNLFLDQACFLAIKKREKTIEHFEPVFNEIHRSQFDNLCKNLSPYIIIISNIYNAISGKDLVNWKRCFRQQEAHKDILFNVFNTSLDSDFIKCEPYTGVGIDLIIDIVNFLCEVYLKNNKFEQIELLKKYYLRILHGFNCYINHNLNKDQVFISSRNLVLYILLLIIKEIIMDEASTSTLSVLETLTLYSRLARTIKFYFIRTQDEEQKKLVHFYEDYQKKEHLAAEATNYFLDIAHLVSEYASLVGGTPRELRIEEHLNFAAISQAIFYTLKKHYRDHFSHVLDVCFFGLLFIKEILLQFLPMSDSNLVRNWMAASLFHDIAHVMEIHELVCEETGYLKSKEIDKFTSGIQDELRKQSQEFYEVVKQKFNFLKIELPPFSVDSLNHSIVSAAYLLSLLENIPTREESQKSQLLQGYRAAIEAAALHNLSGREIHLTNEPVAWLLYLCDELQDWDRPRIEALPFRQQMLAAVKYGTGVSPGGASMLKTVKLDVEGNPFAGGVRLKESDGKRILPIILDYQEIKDDDFYIIYSWLVKSYKFQFLVLPEDFDIVLTFLSTPRAHEGDLNRLKAARRKWQIWDFEKWFQLVDEKTDASAKPGAGIERLEISLQELHRTFPLPQHPVKHLETLIKEWKD